ncbi:hypothetical protein LCGC14_0387100 [marine sediment metagenome]|uniref:Uncharacterized protein n=1 Tax=marine sediment metagenome TaxID=412755 RepID=A0A0F9TIW6_9ZZZZ
MEQNPQLEAHDERKQLTHIGQLLPGNGSEDGNTSTGNAFDNQHSIIANKSSSK